MSTFLHLSHPLVWLRRFRHRRGYGVHSPFAFNFITRIVYERARYYDYDTLREEEKAFREERGHQFAEEPLRVRRLLFRLANNIQPATIVDIGNETSASLYLKAGCRKADYKSIDSAGDLPADIPTPLLLYLHHWRDPQYVEDIFNTMIEKADQRSLFIIEGIGYSRAMRRLWRRLQTDSRTGITFDLFDVGILFFDLTKYKQHYIVNF
jgi:hypothetical protein